MSTKYEWTDWITHIPGQELPAGLWGQFEFLGRYANGGKPYVQEGLITKEHRGHGVWHTSAPGGNGNYVMLLRYKLRIESDEQEVPQEVTNPVKIVESA